MHLLILLTLKAYVSFLRCCNSRISCSFCFYLPYLLFYSSLHSNFTFVLLLWWNIIYLQALTQSSFLWILRNSRTGCSWVSFCCHLFPCLHPYCWTLQDSYFGSLFSFYLFFPEASYSGFSFYLCANVSKILYIQFSSVHAVVSDSATPWIAARQASLSITSSRSSLKLMPIESVMPCNHLILCHPLLLLPPIPPSIRVFSNESTLHLRWLMDMQIGFLKWTLQQNTGNSPFKIKYHSSLWKQLNCLRN